MNSFEISLEQIENNKIDADGVKAMSVCNSADDTLAALKRLLEAFESDARF